MASAYPLDPKKWFDRFQPQTLQIATFLLYFSGFFALIGFLSETDWVGRARAEEGGIGTLVGISVVAAYIGGGWLMANERKWGHRLALYAAFSPFAFRVWLYWGDDRFGMREIVFGPNIIGFIFDVGLIALLLHNQTKEHVRIYFR